MADPVYATAEQLAASPYLPSTTSVPTGDEADRLLARASRKIDALLRLAVYDTDDNDQPTDPDVAQALADATCATVAWWVETGDESGAQNLYQSVAIGSVSLSRGTRQTAVDVTIAPAAVDVLVSAGLFAEGPILWA